VEVRALRHADARAAARVLSEAFRDDPFWLAVGPRAGAHRRIVTWLTNRIELASAVRRPDPAYVAIVDGHARAIALVSAGGVGAGTLWSTLHAWGLALGGPGTLRRARQVGHVVGAARPRGAHLYLASLAVAPSHQRRGLGTALMERVLAEAAERDLGLALETMREENVAWYERFGFSVESRTSLTGLDVWFMRRARQSAASMRSTSSRP
jgi:ribosomal protein S18 acetylase RimI-like enzyme